eukprot:14403713-Ditylum_brightwellii.AAC.1
MQHSGGLVRWKKHGRTWTGREWRKRMHYRHTSQARTRPGITEGSPPQSAQLEQICRSHQWSKAE